MIVLLNRILLGLVSAIGALLICNSIFHLMIYAVENKSILESLRPLHLISLLAGIGILYFGVVKHIKVN